MYREDKVTTFLDWPTVLIYAACVLMGWFNIFAAVYDVENQKSIYDLSLNSGKQLLWIGTAVLLIIAVLVIDYRFYDTFAFVLYGFTLIALVGVLLLARDVNGAKSWFEIGSFRVQPSEFAKFTTALAVAKYLGQPGLNLEKWKDLLPVGVLLAVPALLILFQNDTGSFLVFSAFIIVLYREGLSPVIPALGIVAVIVLVLTLLIDLQYLTIGFALLAGVIIFNLRRRNFANVALVVVGFLLTSGMAFGVGKFIALLQPHQQIRIKSLVNPAADPQGIGYQVDQSKIAIGSGGLLGKGFLEGTQTKLNFVPEQSTDFIFCTIGEEHGWVGSLVVIGLFMGLFTRLMYLAERQKDRFARIYGYSVVSIMFFHFFINVGMVIGLLPVIGIPLPFFSYGGSSLWSFTILLFIFLKLDAHRLQAFTRY
ncbi:MAG: rod shape-determining protein RodA [Ferruginibacter sp.]|nr:rod shape-determining protein RodA [Cytophagales bacterium]